MSYPAVIIDAETAAPLMARLWIDRHGRSFIDVVPTVDRRGVGLRATVRVGASKGRSPLVLFEEVKVNGRVPRAMRLMRAGINIFMKNLRIVISEISKERARVLVGWGSRDDRVILEATVSAAAADAFAKAVLGAAKSVGVYEDLVGKG